jgi:poly(A) polymerase
MPAEQIATKIVQRLVDAGHIAFFAGGWVRDYLMKHPSDDIDIATSASVAHIQELFVKTIPVGVAFGIVIIVEEGHQFEVATFRKDCGYVDGRRPTGIEPATPQEDALRRDFTINGMFYDPLGEVIYDFVDGQKDIERKVIKAIGDPNERFREDRLRMMRAVRYSTRFNFPIDPDTIMAIRTHAKTLLPSVAMERIWQEFKKMAHFEHFDTGLITLHQLGLLQTIFPTLAGVPIEEIQKRVSCIEHFPKSAPPIAELLELFPGSTLGQIYILCDTLKLSSEEKAFAEFLHHAESLINMPEKWLEKLELIEWATFYANPHVETCLEIIAAKLPSDKQSLFLDHHYKQRQLLQQPIFRIQSKTPIVRAEHLMAEGVAPGKKMGQLLKEAERLAVNQSIDDRNLVIDLLKKSPLW